MPALAIGPGPALSVDPSRPKLSPAGKLLWYYQLTPHQLLPRAGELYALGAANGTVLFKTPMSAGSNAPVAVDGDYVIAGAGAALSPRSTT